MRAQIVLYNVRIPGVAIVGGGPTGLSAATDTSRADCRTLVFDNGGGTTRDVDTMENVYGFPDGVTGPELVDPGQRHARKYGAEIVEEKVVRIEPTDDSYRVATTDDEYDVEGVILATGMDYERPEGTTSEPFADVTHPRCFDRGVER
jgi:thioredoxin reductase (NADPH)